MTRNEVNESDVHPIPVDEGGDAEAFQGIPVATSFNLLHGNVHEGIVVGAYAEPQLRVVGVHVVGPFEIRKFAIGHVAVV